MKKRWYVAILIIRCRVDDDVKREPTCDEQIRVLRAYDDDDAYDQAIVLGRNEEIDYKNGEGNTVRWEFVGLKELQELDSPVIRHGTEILSHLFGDEHPENLVKEKGRLKAFEHIAS